MSRLVRRLLVALIAGVVQCAVPSSLVAQTNGGSISGYVTNQAGEVLPSATVKVINAASEGPEVSTDGNGYYRVPRLVPGTYTLVTERAGFARAVRDDVVVREGINLSLHVTMTLGVEADQVTVEGDAPLLEWKNAVQSFNVSGELQKRLPLSSLRTWADFMQLVPGIVTTQARFQTYSLHGTGGASAVFLVDGVDATSVLQGSPFYAQFARGTFEDIQIKTGAVDAVSPLGLGAVVSVVTRSGTNRFGGESTALFQPKRWNGSNATDGQSLTLDIAQLDAVIGGPILRDRLWFIGSGRVMRNHTGVSRSPQQLSVLRALDPAFIATDNGWSGAVGFGKITGRLFSGTQFQASMSHDTIRIGGIQPHEAGDFRTLRLGGASVSARVSSVWNSSVLSTVSVGYNGRRQRNLSRAGRTGINVYESVFASGGRLIGSGLLATVNGSASGSIDFPVDATTMAWDLTMYENTRIGSHEVRAGIYLQPRRRNRWVTRYDRDGIQLEEAVLRGPADPSAGYTLFRRQIFDVSELTSLDIDSQDYAFYAQNDWRVNRRLSLTAGVRTDFVKRVDKLFDVVTQDSVEIGPRFGINYALTDDGRQIARASWSRVHDNLSVNETQAGSNIAGFTDFYDIAGDGSLSSAFATPGVTQQSRNLVIDLQGYHQPRVDEISAGYHRQLPGRTAVGVNVTRREYRARPAVVERNGLYDGEVFAGYRDESQNEIYALTANDWNWPVSTMVTLEATKEGPRFELVASYARQWSHIAGTWQPNDPAAIIQPDAFRNAGGIGFVAGCTVGPCADSNSLSGTLGTGSWRDHIVNAAGSYQHRAGLVMAANYTFQSGPWSGPIFTRLAAPDPRFGPPTVTLSNGRVVSNPLATPVRFAFATRSDGQFRLAPLHTLNARVGWTFGTQTRRLEVGLDVLNVTNGGADQAFRVDGNRLDSPWFGQGANRQFPRSAQVFTAIVF